MCRQTDRHKSYMHVCMYVVLNFILYINKQYNESLLYWSLGNMVKHTCTILKCIKLTNDENGENPVYTCGPHGDATANAEAKDGPVNSPWPGLGPLHPRLTIKHFPHKTLELILFLCICGNENIFIQYSSKFVYSYV